MTHEDFERAQELSDKIDSVRKSIGEINCAFERRGHTENKNGFKRMFLRFTDLKRHLAGSETVTYLFFPERLHGLEIGLDEEFVLSILDFLNRRLDKLEKEFSEIGRE